MEKPRAHLDPASLGSVENLRGPLEDQVTSAMDRAVDKVEEHYQGEGVDEVAQQLMEQTKAGLHPDIAEAIGPDQAQMRSVAADLVDENS